MSEERILVVDDEPAIVQLARLYLAREGFRVQDAGDGEAELEAINGARPALVILDVMLPKLDGFEVSRRQQPPATLSLSLYRRLETRKSTRSWASNSEQTIMLPSPSIPASWWRGSR